MNLVTNRGHVMSHQIQYKPFKDTRKNIIDLMAQFASNFCFRFIKNGETLYVWNSSQAEKEYDKLDKLISEIDNSPHIRRDTAT